MFKEYQSKPVTRRAMKIEGEPDELYHDFFGWRYAGVAFHSHVKPIIGDYIINNGDGDVYRCSAEVFEARNVVE